MQKQFSIAEAKNRLPTIVHSVENGPPVELTRRGKPVAVLLSIQEIRTTQPQIYRVLACCFAIQAQA